MHTFAPTVLLLRTSGRVASRQPALCFRSISTSCSLRSGHNRWSKIKHDKAKADAGLSKVRSYLSKEISTAVKAGGADPRTNQRLASILLEAKRSDFPKTSIERAIARGQGISPSGAALDAVTVEFMLPAAGAAGIIEIETDSRGRTMQDVKAALKEHGASVTPIAYLFDRKGRVEFGKVEGKSEDEVLESAIEVGALDVEDAGEEGGVGESGYVVWTEPGEMASVAEGLMKALGVTARSQDLVWVPKEDATIEPGNEDLERLVNRLEDLQEVQEIYLNTA